MNEDNDLLPLSEESAVSIDQQSTDVVVESSFVELGEPGEYPPPEPPKKQIKPAVLALGTIAGMLVLCVVMLMILVLLLWPEVSAGF